MKKLLGIVILMSALSFASAYDISLALEDLVSKFDEPAMVTPMVIAPIIEEQTGEIQDQFINDLYLTGCYRSQDEDSHILKGNGSAYAIDIGCGGKEFIVYNPMWYATGIVKYTGYDSRLGYYITIGYEKEDIIFGHTVSDLSIGTIINRGDIIGNTKVSGISNGPHLHIEKWVNDKNVSWGKNKVNDNTDKLKAQRGRIESPEWNYKYITDKVREVECPNGYILKSYYDYKQYSIGCGTYSYEGEEITEQEAEDRFQVALIKRLEKLKSELDGYNNNQRASLISLYFNCPKCYNGLLDDGITEANWKRYIFAGGEKMQGLVKRRDKEWNLFIK